MRGLNFEELKQIEDFINKHHKFATYIPEKERKYVSKHIKYWDLCYDFRTDGFWLVKFRGFQKWCFSINMFVTHTFFDKDYEAPSFDSLFDWVMAFLKEEWIPDDTYLEISDIYFED